MSLHDTGAFAWLLCFSTKFLENMIGKCGQISDSHVFMAITWARRGTGLANIVQGKITLHKGRPSVCRVEVGNWVQVQYSATLSTLSSNP